MTTSHRYSPDVYDCVLPRPSVPTWQWVADHISMPRDSKIRGRFRRDLFPQWEEPANCFDDPDIDRISVGASSQIGKTVFAQACMAKTGATNPHPMMFADADERSTRRVIRRTWRLFERCDLLAHQVPPRKVQASDRMELRTFVIHGAWAGSAATAADVGALVVVKNETDKMRRRSTDTEAAFQELLDERTKGYVGATIIEISTPSVKGASYIESQVLAGDNRRRNVPCPHCNHFQELRTGDGRSPGGVKFKRLASGKIDPQLARESAYYECEKCRKAIHEQHRYEMCNSGLWVPEGCRIERGRVVGKPARPGRHASFGELSTLHSLLPGVTIGVYAEAFVRAITSKTERREKVRNFVNSWEGRTWDPAPVTVQPHELAERMAVDEPLRVCPAWSRFLTVGADVGQFGEMMCFYVWVSAWGLHGRGQLVDYKIVWKAEEMYRVIREELEYPHADGGPPLRPVRGGIDSGSFTEAIYSFVAPLRGMGWWPVKGSSKDPLRPFATGADAGFEMYKLGFQKTDVPPKLLAAKIKTGQADLILPNSRRTQQWVENRVTGLITRDAADWYSIPREVFEGEIIPGVDIAEQLLNDYEDDAGRWCKKGPQEARDGWRYSQVMAWAYKRNGQDWAKDTPRQTQSAARERRRSAPPAFGTPDGRSFLVTDR